jgi:hypothetical protein
MRRARALIAIVLLAGACRGGGETDAPQVVGRGGSVRVQTPSHVAIGAVPASYRVAYRVEDQDGEAVRTSEAALAVDAPFRTRLEVRTDKRITSLRVAHFAYLGRRIDDEDRVLTAVPGPSSDALRADLVLDEGTGEVRRVLDSLCEVHELGGPLLDNPGELVLGEGVDVCIDARGLVLEQIEHGSDGAISRRWIATDVRARAALADRDVTLAGVEPVDAAEGGGSVQDIEPTSAPPGTFWQLDAPPAGFTRRGRYAIVPPQSARTDDEHTRAQVLAGVVDVFVRGADVILVDQGGTLGGVPPFGSHPDSTAVDVGELARTAEWFRTPTGFEVRALLPPGHYVRVVGTVPVDELLALARQLHPIDGQGITYR